MKAVIVTLQAHFSLLCCMLQFGKSHTVAAHHMQEDLPSGHCGKRAVWDIPVHHSQSTPHNAEYNPPESNRDVCFETQIYLSVC